MKKAIFIFLITILTASFTSSYKVFTEPYLPSCEQGEKLAQKTWEKWGEWNPNIGLKSFKAQVLQLRKSWKWIANKSGKSTGSRRLEINGENDLGTLSENSKNTFATPPSLNNKVTVTINKYEGTAAAGISICTHAQNGVINTITSYQFPRGEDTQVKTFVINNARGKVVTVAMKCNSAENKFTYRIKAN